MPVSQAGGNYYGLPYKPGWNRAPNNMSGPQDTFNPVTGSFTPPSGYEWDPVQSAYGRTPASAGSRKAETANAFLSGVGMGGVGSKLSGALGGLAMSAPGAGVFGGGGGGTSGGGVLPSGQGISGGQAIQHVKAPDTSAAEAAEFGKAKDLVGQQNRAALTSLQDVMAAQGMLGSGAQVQGARDIIQSGLGELGDVRRQQAIKRADLGSEYAKLGYQGDITQRGQDIAAQEAAARLAQQQAQLNWQQQQAQNQQQLQMLQMALSGLGGLY